MCLPEAGDGVVGGGGAGAAACGSRSGCAGVARARLPFSCSMVEGGGSRWRPHTSTGVRRRRASRAMDERWSVGACASHRSCAAAGVNATREVFPASDCGAWSCCDGVTSVLTGGVGAAAGALASSAAGAASLLGGSRGRTVLAAGRRCSRLGASGGEATCVLRRMRKNAAELLTQGRDGKPGKAATATAPGPAALSASGSSVSMPSLPPRSWGGMAGWPGGTRSWALAFSAASRERLASGITSAAAWDRDREPPAVRMTASRLLAGGHMSGTTAEGRSGLSAWENAAGCRESVAGWLRSSTASPAPLNRAPFESEPRGVHDSPKKVLMASASCWDMAARTSKLDWSCPPAAMGPADAAWYGTARTRNTNSAPGVEGDPVATCATQSVAQNVASTTAGEDRR